MPSLEIEKSGALSATNLAPARALTRAAWPLMAALSVAFVIGVPLCLVSNNVRFVTLDPNTYLDGFEKYRTAERSGLDRVQLSAIGRAFIDYFQGPPGRLEPVVMLDGSRRPLFGEREVRHMVDVQRLMQAVFRAGLVSAGYLGLCAAVLIGWRRRAGLIALGRLTLWGSALSIVTLVAVAALSLVDFGDLFVRFHQLSFNNDLWQLDPRRDYLLILFPEGFWLDVTLKLAALTAAESLVLGAVGFWLVRR